MKYFLFSLCLIDFLAFSGCGRSSLWRQSDFRSAGEFPYAVKILDPLEESLCSGVVLSPGAVLTAAHCALKEAPLVIVSLAGVVVSRERILGGSGAEGDSMDLAILLPEDPILLPRYPELAENLRAGELVRMAGFGSRAFGRESSEGVLGVGEGKVESVADFAVLITPLAGTRGIWGGSGAGALAPGDSGALAVRKQGTGDELVGLGHAVVWDAYNYYSELIDLTQTAQREFLRTENDRLGLGIRILEAAPVPEL